MNSGEQFENDSALLAGANGDGDDPSTMSLMYKSPGSMLDSSIRTNQVQSFDIESESIIGENPGWKLGTPWFSNNTNKESRSNNAGTHEVDRYYGGIMKGCRDSPKAKGLASPHSTTSSQTSRSFLPFRRGLKRISPSKQNKSSSKGKRENGASNGKLQHTSEKRNVDRKAEDDNRSIAITRTKSNGADSIADFDDSEWTPPDSSYGAACPVCGFIPKRVRQMIEMTLIAAMIFYLIYLLVMISNKIAEKSAANANASDNHRYNVTANSDVYLDDAINNDYSNEVGNNYADYDDGYNNIQYDTDDYGGGQSQNYQNNYLDEYYNYNKYKYNQQRYYRESKWYTSADDDFNRDRRSLRRERISRELEIQRHDRIQLRRND